MKNWIKKEQGITLIALVTTIVVLLILASITIGAVSGEGGLIGNANEAKEKTEIANEKEAVDRAVVQAMGKNKRGNLVRSELQDELDIITGEGETEVTIDEADYGYFVKFLDSGRIYKVSRDGEVKYLGKEEELLTQANIIANPESNTTPEFIQSVDLTVETPIDIGDVDFMLVSAWSQDKNVAPEDSEFKVAQLTGEGRRRTTTVNSSASVGGDYYLWVRVVVGEIEKEECFGPYAIKDHTTLVATDGEGASESPFLGMPIERGLIQSIEIKNTLIGTGHSLDDGNTYDVTDGKKGKYLGWYEQNDNGYYEVTIAGEGEIVANGDSTNLFAHIGYGITDTSVEITIEGLEYLDTGLVTDMTNMFLRCKASNLNLSKFNTSKVASMNGMFFNCSKLETLDLSSFDTNNVTTFGQMFEGCSNLRRINLESFNTENVTRMNNMFYGCSKLEEINLSNFNTSKVNHMGGLFSGCSSLKTLDLSNFDTSEVTIMNNMFDGCNSLTSIDISSFNTYKVSDMNKMFMGCSSLVELDLSNFDTSNVTNMGNMFRGCNRLTELDLSNFNTEKVTSMEWMFVSQSLKSLDISNFKAKDGVNINRIFYYCSNLTKLDMRNFDMTKTTGYDNYTMYPIPKNCEILVNSSTKQWFTDNLSSYTNVIVVN